MILLGKLICAFRPHRWRKPHKSERQAIPVEQRFNGWAGTANFRVCDRCGLEREVKRRVTK